METPDKIYIGIQDLGSGYVYALSLDNNGEQEYIRKDALLEWLEEKLKERHAPQFRDALGQVIDKINSL